jgi:hypothetical protein
MAVAQRRVYTHAHKACWLRCNNCSKLDQVVWRGMHSSTAEWCRVHSVRRVYVCYRVTVDAGVAVELGAVTADKMYVSAGKGSTPGRRGVDGIDAQHPVVA